MSPFKIRRRAPLQKSWSGYLGARPRGGCERGGGTRGFRARLQFRRRTIPRGPIDRSMERTLARSRSREDRDPCMTPRVMYTARDTRTLATIAGSALARGGARTFSSWRYRAASRRLPTSPPPHSWRERRRPSGGAAPGPHSPTEYPDAPGRRCSR